MAGGRQLTVHFAASILACWNANAHPVISADLQTDTLLDMAENLAGIITDSGVSAATTPIVDVNQPEFRQTDRDGSPAGKLENPQFEANGTALVLFTSGSTGKKKRVDKPFFSLFEEINNLEHQFGPLVDGLSRRSTVSHFHIYGFLFNILWPLHFGHPIGSASTFYWEQALQNGANGGCIISSPAHLRLLCSIDLIHQFNWKKSIIFSSGGPLNRHISLEIRNATGCPPTEIFGSTETGGVAMRQQSKEADRPFTPFSRVRIRKNHVGGLEVQSPWLDTPNQWVETGDRIDLTESGEFFLLGRYDTVVKIAGKRVSLTEMEAAVRKLPDVADVRIFQYRDESRESRGVLAAVIALRPGIPIPSGPDKRERVTAFKKGLLRRFDLVTLPRYWRFTENLPVNQQGKTPLELLEKMVRNGS